MNVNMHVLFTPVLEGVSGFMFKPLYPHISFGKGTDSFRASVAAMVIRKISTSSGN